MRILLCIALFLLPLPLRAHPVINEILWAGSDLSTADEWLEIHNPDATDADLSGWALTSLNSKGEHAVAYRFQTGAVLSAGESIVLASKGAASSRLAAEPFAVTSSLTLPNTKLLVRLLDSSGMVVDEADDGVGAPFAGSNPSGTGSKASMERIDFFAAGNLKENWRTAAVSQGFDDGAPVLGTPGSAGEQQTSPEPEEAPPEEPAPSIPEEPVPIAAAEPMPSASDEPIPTVLMEPTPCTDPLAIDIAIQSGSPTGVGKVTLNLQAVATAGSLAGVACSFDFGDGFRSTSCNPPSHSFTQPGAYTIRLEAKNQCGNTLSQELRVAVQPDPSTASSSVEATVPYDGSKLILSGALPNPEGTDTDREWVEVRNLEEKPVDLLGWYLRIGETSVKTVRLRGTVPALQKMRIYNSEISFTLPNSTSKVELFSPWDHPVSRIQWDSAEDGVVQRTDELRGISVAGRVVHVADALTFDLELEGDARRILGDEVTRVRLLGLSEENEGNTEILRALIQDQRVDLEFDTDLWHQDGSLQAYVFASGVLVQQQLLATGLWSAQTDGEYRRKEDFLALDTYVPRSVASESLVQGALVEEQKMSAWYPTDGISFSEIYASPYPASSPLLRLEWQGKEWLELMNTHKMSVDLSGWVITVDGKKKSLPSGLRAVSGSLTIVPLALKNDGAVLQLQSPSGEIVDTLTYPKLKHGQSFAKGDNGFCLSITPTPGLPNTCIAPLSPSAVRKAAARKTAAKKVAKHVAAYKAQVRGIGEEARVVYLPSSTNASPAFLVVLSFVLGLGCAALAGLLLRRKLLIAGL